MSRKLRTLVTVTGLGSLACGASGKLLGPPKPMPSDLAPKTGALPTGPTDGFQSARSLNATHEKHGTIYVGYGEPAECYVHLPFEGRPTSWQPPETKAVECPEELHDAAWLECRGGTLFTNEAGDQCVCSLDGNPPPPRAWVHCPDSAKTPE